MNFHTEIKGVGGGGRYKRIHAIYEAVSKLQRMLWLGRAVF